MGYRIYYFKYRQGEAYRYYLKSLNPETYTEIRSEGLILPTLEQAHTVLYEHHISGFPEPVISEVLR